MGLLYILLLFFTEILCVELLYGIHIFTVSFMVCQSCLLLCHDCDLSPVCVVCSFKEHINSVKNIAAVTTSPYTSSYFGP